MKTFGDDLVISSASWAAFERLILRIIRAKNYDYSSIVGESGDGGADVLAVSANSRWLFQAKAYNKPIGPSVVNQTVDAARLYEADVPVVVSKNGFSSEAFSAQASLVQAGIRLQLWDKPALNRQLLKLPETPPILTPPRNLSLRDYQSSAIESIYTAFNSNKHGSALVVLATGLGKTFVAAEGVRRILRDQGRVLVLAHTTDLVYQLERAFWPFLTRDQRTTVLTGTDRVSNLDDLLEFDFIFATRDSVDSLQRQGFDFGFFDVVVVDECHHLGSEVYERVLDTLGVGSDSGPFLLGLTATPWRPTGEDLSHRFDAPVINVDLATGLKDGYLANVDYRMYTDNIDWDSLRHVSAGQLSPKDINRTLFIEEWDDAVVGHLRDAWVELDSKGRAIVFCGTIEHALKMTRQINSLGFASARAIYSSTASPGVPTLKPFDRSKILWDFADGRINILCTVDILNEGVDVPDVNLVVFQRVTHSRRIFMQQLGRGLRLSPGKSKVIVLDFVTDIRRFAAGLQLDRDLNSRDRKPQTVRLNSQVKFMRNNEIDKKGHDFLAEWLKDIDAIEAAGDDVSILAFPPSVE